MGWDRFILKAGHTIIKKRNIRRLSPEHDRAFITEDLWSDPQIIKILIYRLSMNLNRAKVNVIKH